MPQIKEFIERCEREVLLNQELPADLSTFVFNVVKLCDRLESQDIERSVSQLQTLIESHSPKVLPILSVKDVLALVKEDIQGSIDFLIYMPILYKLAWSPHFSPLNFITQAMQKLKKWVEPNYFIPMYGDGVLFSPTPSPLPLVNLADSDRTALPPEIQHGMEGLLIASESAPIVVNSAEKSESTQSSLNSLLVSASASPAGSEMIVVGSDMASVLRPPSLVNRMGKSSSTDVSLMIGQGRTCSLRGSTPTSTSASSSKRNTPKTVDEIPYLHIGSISKFRRDMLEPFILKQLPLVEWNVSDEEMIVKIFIHLFGGNFTAYSSFVTKVTDMLNDARSSITLYQRLTLGVIADERATLQPLVHSFLKDIFQLYRTMFPDGPGYSRLNPDFVLNVNNDTILAAFPRGENNLYEKYIIRGYGDIVSDLTRKKIIAQIKSRLVSGECAAEKDQFFFNMVSAVQYQIAGDVALIRPDGTHFSTDMDPVTIGQSLNADPNARGATVGMLTDLFSIFIGYGCYKDGKFHFGMTDLNSPATIMDAKQYVLRLLFIHCTSPELLIPILNSESNEGGTNMSHSSNEMQPTIAHISTYINPQKFANNQMKFFEKNSQKAPNGTMGAEDDSDEYVADYDADDFYSDDKYCIHGDCVGFEGNLCDDAKKHSIGSSCIDDVESLVNFGFSSITNDIPNASSNEVC